MAKELGKRESFYGDGMTHVKLNDERISHMRPSPIIRPEIVGD
ncbi:hypothetical protein Pla52n_28430 [Stieleria varia]|uniref:Uncharacterized protein n=1 Tax=Stieleria varia TaxID=2528005 RepID=A0A5C6B023_9BACT|nr:hypothetical protein Pla52n_28430 [Stieleria varia]